ncbi:hypothetical protein [Aquincola sp. J276]|uniref:hypothetical protein n=1 Tax=Aquincola sp. J276 TaxID=2898432 RepID=UPI0021508996|nr:hypothetical protein [Aquincola sp. J276]MCR5869144.1 hypothetical protein [Aquincola sp. J276]
MSSRLLALFLSFVLLWSGATAHEQPLIVVPGGTPAATAAVLAAPGSADLADGSVADHHLDDLPAQALADAALDAPALPPAPPRMPAPAAMPAAPPLYLPAAWSPSPPGSLHRPPRQAPAHPPATR